MFERIICIGTERYKLLFFSFGQIKFYGQVHFGFLLAPGQVENFTISTPLVIYYSKQVLHELYLTYIGKREF